METFEPTGGGHFWKVPHRYVNAITDEENKLVRRKALNIILDELQKSHSELKEPSNPSSPPEAGDGDDSSISNQEKREEVLQLIRPLMKSISDPVERCRETAFEIIALIFQLLTVEEQELYLPYIIPPLTERFGEPEILEPSEEVRLTAIKVMTGLMETAEKKVLMPYVEDLIQILSFFIADPFHSVKIASCQATSYLAMKTKETFHMTSDRLLAPLCLAITHQQFRVRCAVIECLGDVVLFGNHKSFNDVIPHVTQRLFDSNPNVRKLVIAVSANWLMNYIDRYSYFNKLLPIILTGLSDESPENADLGKELWRKVGEKYLLENEDEHKDEINFPKKIDTSKGPWSSIERPILGCRILVWRHVGNILPGVVNDITDWVLSTRIKCAQIFFQLVLHSEDKIVMHVQKALQGLTLSINDESSTVVNYIKKTAGLIGFFVPLDSSFPVLVTGITSSSSLGPLKVLQSVAEGAKLEDLEAHVDDIGKILSDKDLCQTLNVEKQRTVVDIGLVVVRRGGAAVGNSESATKSFFTVGITIFAMTRDPGVSKIANDLLQLLSQVKSFQSQAELVNSYCGDILEDIRGNSSEWTALSADKLIFEKILAFGGLVVNSHGELILRILSENLSPKRDPEVRLRFFAMLAENLPHFERSVEHENTFHGFVKHIIEEVLSPNLVWVAGKTASALRTASASCILAILHHNILPPQILTAMAPELIPALVSILDDSVLLTRQVACQSLEKVVTCCARRLGPDITNKIYPALVKRLDDVSNDVRFEACIALDALFKNLSPDYDPDFFKLHIMAVVSALIVHLDDDEHEIRELIYGILVNLGKLRSSDVCKECEKFRTKHRTPEMCDRLIAELARSTAAPNNTTTSNNDNIIAAEPSSSDNKDTAGASP